MSDIPKIPDDLIEYSPEIIQAKKEGKPIVALESTIITHGMEYPENHKTATKLEETIKAEGAVPATICILHGKIRVGLDKDTLKNSCRFRQRYLTRYIQKQNRIY